MRKHKGQAIVEFALVLPLFLLMIFGIIYSGMMFHDYSTISNIARATTREAAVFAGGEDELGGIADHYKERLNNGLLTSFYIPVGDNPIVITQDGDVIQTTINMQLNVNGFFVDMILPKAFGVRYYMQKEPYTNSPP